ncbi:MAG: adenylyltransferase/cytidyltransferase family protein, partial [Candidatus Methylomirabilales bacterium]
MIVVEDIEALRERYPFVVATVGIFDGVHLGHQKILERVLERAKAKGGISCVYTFANHPLEVLNPGRSPKLITPPEVKREIVRVFGIDLLISVPFTPSLANTPPREFVEEVLVKNLNVKEVCVGFNFT